VNKRLLLVIGIISVLLIVFIVLTIRKANMPLQGIVGKSAAVSGLLAEAKKQEIQQDLLAAKNAYQKLVNEFPNSREVIDWQKKIEEINIKLLFSPTITPKSIEYEIKAGDSLEKIAKDYKTTAELIMKSNNLKDDRIFPGKKIKVWTAPFSIVVDKSQNTLILKSDEEIIKTYIVSTGTNNSTPVGTFKIIEKIINPPWYKPGAVIPPGSPENILGSRWIGLDKEGYGIHGTKDPQSLGKQVTAGCVRMSNPDIEELYSIIPNGTEVTIVD
jgi:lipoprotein-anchoring transpeptidase ErfK/SrfK